MSLHFGDACCPLTPREAMEQMDLPSKTPATTSDLILILILMDRRKHNNHTIRQGQGLGRGRGPGRDWQERQFFTAGGKERLLQTHSFLRLRWLP